MAVVFYSPASPYSAKVRLAAAWCNIPVEAKIVDTGAEPLELLNANPLGKIPVLITDDGTSIFDSRTIMQHLNRLSSGGLYPRNADKHLESEMLEALADGICDCLLAHVYERRMRPEEKIHQPWLDKQWSKATRALDILAANPPKLTKKANGGQIALRATLGYLALRFDGKWEKGRTKLTRWAKRFDERFPELAELLPRA